ncbi:hypothetical protein K466DRAFT_578026 [Polyporus arcularius HHB13444]|uniref:BED-type domain-containing protein n=1 Tax=Polyporus arcularius HHB13444 TaxID=1314778 RepID=A0A5C3P2C7_9APHY|nr:hypothetical protein K466DRAFT_578026 [Polyporus arcularius HHB13444]
MSRNSSSSSSSSSSRKRAAASPPPVNWKKQKRSVPKPCKDPVLVTAPQKLRAKPVAKSNNARALSSKGKAAADDTASSNPGPSRSTRASRQTTVRTEEEEAEELEREGFTFVDEDDGEGRRTRDGSSRGDGSGSEESSSSDDEGASGEEPIGSEDKLESMMSQWNSPIYAFFEARPTIEYVEGRRTHVFKCLVRGCGQKIRRYLDSKDRSSTGNLRRHARSCWGEETVDKACEAVNIEEARAHVVGSLLRNGTITASFKRKTGKVTYSHRPHTKAETRTEIVRWVAESLRPFKIVRDRRFLTLMKTGRPWYYIPSPSTVSRDAKMVFKRTRVLGVTCDNTSNNDTMIEELASVLPSFPGAPNRV